MLTLLLGVRLRLGAVLEPLMCSLSSSLTTVSSRWSTAALGGCCALTSARLWRMVSLAVSNSEAWNRQTFLNAVLHTRFFFYHCYMHCYMYYVTMLHTWLYYVIVLHTQLYYVMVFHTWLYYFSATYTIVLFYTYIHDYYFTVLHSQLVSCSYLISINMFIFNPN